MKPRNNQVKYLLLKIYKVAKLWNPLQLLIFFTYFGTQKIFFSIISLKRKTKQIIVCCLKGKENLVFLVAFKKAFFTSLIGKTYWKYYLIVEDQHQNILRCSCHINMSMRCKAMHTRCRLCQLRSSQYKDLF